MSIFFYPYLCYCISSVRMFAATPHHMYVATVLCGIGGKHRQDKIEK